MKIFSINDEGDFGFFSRKMETTYVATDTLELKRI